jgi:hypothetical protein
MHKIGENNFPKKKLKKNNNCQDFNYFFDHYIYLWPK